MLRQRVLLKIQKMEPSLWELITIETIREKSGQRKTSATVAIDTT
jgi:hypothetical protein